MLRNCPNNRANIKLFVCPKCGKAFKYQNQKLIELSKSKDVFTNKNTWFDHLKKLESNENRDKCLQQVKYIFFLNYLKPFILLN